MIKKMGIKEIIEADNQNHNMVLTFCSLRIYQIKLSFILELGFTCLHWFKNKKKNRTP